MSGKMRPVLAPSTALLVFLGVGLLALILYRLFRRGDGSREKALFVPPVPRR